MIIVIVPSGPTAEDHAARVAGRLFEFLATHIPMFHRAKTRYWYSRERGICGDHNLVIPTRQGLCPQCAGYLHDAERISRMREMAKRLEAA